MLFALGWAASAHGGGAAALVLTAISVPRALLLLVGGVVADRWPPRAILTVADTVMLAAALALLAVVSVAGTPLWLLVCFALVAGAVSAVYVPMSGTIARRLVSDDAVPQALALQASSSQLIQLVGPPIAGALIGLVGLAGVAAVDACTFALVIGAVQVIGRRMPLEGEIATDRTSVFASMRAGLRTATRTPGLPSALVLTGAVASFGIPVSALLVPLLAREQHWPAVHAGALVTCQAVGSIVTSVAVARRGAFERSGLVAAASTVPMSVGLAAVALQSTVVTAFGMVLFGVGLGLFITHLGPAVLTASPRAQMSRVQSVVALVQTVPILATNNLLGALASRFDVRLALAVSAGMVLAAGIGVCWSAGFRGLCATSPETCSGAR